MAKIVSRAEAVSLGLKRYFTGKPCKNGHIAERALPSSNCVVCSKEYSFHYVRTEEYKEYERARNSTPERIKYRKEYEASDAGKNVKRKYQQSPKGVKARRRYQTSDKCKEAQSIYHRSDAYKNKDKARNKTEKRIMQRRKANSSPENLAKLREKYATDPLVRISQSIRVSQRQCLKGKRKPASTFKTLGCSLEYFMEYIEGMFRDGMTWDNYGEYWHLDHKKPLATFSDLTDPDQFAEAQHWSNLQPLLTHENLAKNANEYFCLDDYKRKNPDRYV